MKIIYNFLPQQRTHPSNIEILNPIVYFSSANSKAVLTKAMLTYVYKISQVTERRKKGGNSNKKHIASPLHALADLLFPREKMQCLINHIHAAKAKAHFSVPAFSAQNIHRNTFNLDNNSP